MTSDRRGDDGDRLEYFRQLERLFIALRGAPLLLSPDDWKVAQRWWREAIPLDLVATTIEGVLSRRAEHRGRSGIRSLKYFAPAVERAWRDLQSLGAAEQRHKATRLDVAARLRSLARALPPSFGGTSDLKARVEGLSGDAESVERELARLDEEMMTAAVRALRPEENRALEQTVQDALSELGGRLPAEERQRLHGDLVRRAVRSRLGLPVLSLFSPAAGGRES